MSPIRACDGYGIWGGGDSFNRYRQCGVVVPRSPAIVSVLASGTEETSHFEWFKCRTVIKLPASFLSCFWDTLLLQASVSEPAVSHAVLALSSVHKLGAVDANGQKNISSNVANEQEQYMLKHYGKAISHLQPHFSNKDRASFRVTLIACFTFICLDFLRGHFEAAQVHLESGLKILEQMQALCNGNNGIVPSRPCRESTDEWIVEAFSRLHLQVELFKHTYQHPCPVLPAAEPETPALVFHSINEAWQPLGRLLPEIFHLTQQGRQAMCECESRRPPPRCLNIRNTFEQGLRGGLTHTKRSRKPCKATCLLGKQKLTSYYARTTQWQRSWQTPVCSQTTSRRLTPTQNNSLF